MAFKVAVLVVLFIITTGLRRTTCKSLQKACQTQVDCDRAYPICDGGFCRAIRSITEIGKFLLAPCNNFKAPCQNDGECSCSSIQMICESNECVVRRNTNTSERKK
ncbi:uncharacterized protein LOC135683832 [Rhopilema esculentum]|uniref:uncharacterized protein LOC135683832 n=1 Tax=Rhopilema esculentum TaxID=499914 RepID=UPI0031DB7EAB